MGVVWGISSRLWGSFAKETYNIVSFIGSFAKETYNFKEPTSYRVWYAVAITSRLLEIIGLFCKRAL